MPVCAGPRPGVSHLVDTRAGAQKPGVTPPEEVFTACAPSCVHQGGSAREPLQPEVGACGPGVLPRSAGQGRGGSGKGVVNSLNHWPGASCTAPMSSVTWSTGRS